VRAFLDDALGAECNRFTMSGVGKLASTMSAEEATSRKISPDAHRASREVPWLRSGCRRRQRVARIEQASGHRTTHTTKTTKPTTDRHISLPAVPR